MIKVTSLLLMSFIGVTLVSAQDLSKQLVKNPKTFEKEHHVTILVDVKVSKGGKALEVKLSEPKRHTSFNQMALLKAKHKTYPIKKSDGKAIEYWLYKMEINETFSPMKAQLPTQLIKPITLKPET